MLRKTIVVLLLFSIALSSCGKKDKSNDFVRVTPPHIETSDSPETCVPCVPVKSLTLFESLEARVSATCDRFDSCRYVRDSTFWRYCTYDMFHVYGVSITPGKVVLALGLVYGSYKSFKFVKSQVYSFLKKRRIAKMSYPSSEFFSDRSVGLKPVVPPLASSSLGDLYLVENEAEASIFVSKDISSPPFSILFICHDIDRYWAGVDLPAEVAGTPDSPIDFSDIYQDGFEGSEKQTISYVPNAPFWSFADSQKIQRKVLVIPRLDFSLAFVDE